MNAFLELVFMLHISDQAEFIKISRLAYLMTYINGQPNLVIELTRPKSC